MKPVIAVVAALAAAPLPVLAAPAAPALFHPAGASFTGEGPVVVNKGATRLNCTAHFAGSTSADGQSAQVTAARFTGGALCGAIGARKLPWSASVTGPGASVIHRVVISASLLGGCGPSEVPGTVDADGVITFDKVALSGNCGMDGHIRTTPALTVR